MLMTSMFMYSYNIEWSWHITILCSILLIHNPHNNPTTHSSPIVSPNDYSITMGLGTGRWSAQSRAIAFAIFAQKYIILSLHRLQFSPKNIWFCLCINSRSANARPSDCPSNDQQCHTSSTLRCVCVFHINIHIYIYCAIVCLLDVLKMLHKVNFKKIHSFFYISEI